MYNAEKVATIADRLNEALKLRGKKQIDLVQATGVNKSTISRYLRGEREPKTTALYKLAYFLDISEAWLLGFDVPMDRTPAQKENDLLSGLVVKMRSDSEFRSLVAQLSELSPEDYQSVKRVVLAFAKK